MFYSVNYRVGSLMFLSIVCPRCMCPISDVCKPCPRCGL